MDQQHLHLFINYLPTIGVFIGIIIFLLGFLFKSYEIRIAAYASFIISAIGELIVYIVGTAPVNATKSIPTISTTTLEHHENYSIYPLITFIILGIVAIIGIILTTKKSRFAKNFDSITLIIIIAAFGLIAWSGSMDWLLRGNNINPVPTGNYIPDSHEKEPIPRIVSPACLNNGQRWIADDVARKAISDLQELTNALSDDPILLKQSLLQRMNRLFQECTMKGEADKQLHNFLIPLIDKIKQLNENSSAADVGSIQSYLGTFQRYFQ